MLCCVIKLTFSSFEFQLISSTTGLYFSYIFAVCDKIEQLRVIIRETMATSFASCHSKIISCNLILLNWSNYVASLSHITVTANNIPKSNADISSVVQSAWYSRLLTACPRRWCILINEDYIKIIAVKTHVSHCENREATTSTITNWPRFPGRSVIHVSQ